MRRLDDLRAQARDSAAAYREAATKMRQARAAYERQVWKAGSPELVVSKVVDSGGRFARADIPAESHSPSVPLRDRQRFKLPPRLVGYYAERAWLRGLEMTPGTVATVDLNDRNVWFAGVVEDRVLDAGSP